MANNNSQGGGYVGAPYNFVPFAKKIIGISPEKMPIHDVISDDLFTGEIGYKFTAQSPIFIDDGDDRFTKDAYGKYAIPGSSVRGLIRSNVQILGMSSVNQDIDDYLLMYRNVASGAEKKAYNEILGSKQVSVSAGSATIGVLTNVRAGYIEKESNGYVIYQTDIDRLDDTTGEMNYYVLSERRISEDIKKGGKNYPYFIKHPEVAQHDLRKGFWKVSYVNKRNEEVTQYKGTPNMDYKPGYYPVSYEITNARYVSKVGDSGVYSNEGYLMCTGNMNMKKVLYIIPHINLEKEPIAISKDEERAFKVDFENKKNTLKRFKNVDFFNLPQKGERKPVFYIQLERYNRLYFGFTPRLRLFYNYLVKEGYKPQEKKFDYARSIFGCITPNGESFKSKVSFSEACCVERKGNVAEKKIILAAPKPSSYLDYLVQNNQGNVTYNTQNFGLRGIKQYWLHSDMTEYTVDERLAKVCSTLRPLDVGTVFSGKIRFNNLSKDELGLLLWALRLEKDSQMNLGQAKSYGYGAVSVSDISLQIMDIKRAYSLDDGLNFKPFEAADPNEYIDFYKSVLAKVLGVPVEKLADISPIREFLLMKNSNCIPSNDTTRYMDINKKEYQSRKKPLPKVTELATNKK